LPPFVSDLRAPAVKLFQETPDIVIHYLKISIDQEMRLAFLAFKDRAVVDFTGRRMSFVHVHWIFSFVEES
jgi:hypothetical protein